MNTLTSNSKFVGAAILFAFLLINQKARAEDVFQIATLYSENDSQGDFIVLNQISSSNLKTLDFDKKAKSVCFTGIWIFYQNPNFNANNTGALTEHMFGPEKSCLNLDFLGLSEKISSIRFVGAPENYQESSITFYQNVLFQGSQEFTSVDKPELMPNIDSLIITGKGFWTLYTEPNFEGVKRCIRPPYPPSFQEHYPAFIGNITEVRVAIHPIRSARKGCFQF